MSSQDLELEELISDLSRREKKARTRHWIYTLVALLVGILWLAYSFYEVNKLQRQSADLKGQIEQQANKLKATNDELKTKNAELATIAESLRVPIEELQNLKNFGFLAGNQNAPDLSTFVQQSRQVKDELRNIKSPTTEKERRGRVSVRYYVRGNDQGRVIVAMESLKQDYGFRIIANQNQKEPNTYSNSIWINNERVTAEDVRLVAYYLMLRGIQLKYLGPPSSKADIVRRQVPEAIIVVAEPKANDEPALTVEKIKGLSLEDMRGKRGTRTLDW